MIEKFIQLLDRKDLDLQAVKNMWNKRALEFSKIEIRKGDPTFDIIEKNMVLDGKSVIDIGFGAGRYLPEFAKRNMQIYGVEISENMIEYACKTLDEMNAVYDKGNLVNSSWEDIDVKAMNWEKKFDLVFLSMSPAISSFVQLQKVLQIAKKGIFLSAHMIREDSLLAELQTELGISLKADYIGKLHIIFNILFEMGYFPDLEFFEQKKQSEMKLDEVFERYLSWIYGTDCKKEQKDLLYKTLKNKEKNGKLVTTEREINGYMFVDLEKTCMIK